MTPLQQNHQNTPPSDANYSYKVDVMRLIAVCLLFIPLMQFSLWMLSGFGPSRVGRYVADEAVTVRQSYRRATMASSQVHSIDGCGYSWYASCRSSINSTIMAFMVDFVRKIGVFCSLISAGGALETTKLKMCTHGGTVRAPFDLQSSRCSTNKDQAAKGGYFLLRYGDGQFWPSSVKNQKFDKNIFREPLVTSKITRGLHPPNYVS